MQKIPISKVGGLNSFNMAVAGARRKLIVLTAYNAPSAVVMPYTEDTDRARWAANRYKELAYSGDGYVEVARLKARLINKLADAGSLLVTRRGVPMAVILPMPTNPDQARKGAEYYLASLGMSSY